MKAPLFLTPNNTLDPKSRIDGNPPAHPIPIPPILTLPLSKTDLALCAQDQIWPFELARLAPPPRCVSSLLDQAESALLIPMPQQEAGDVLVSYI